MAFKKCQVAGVLYAFGQSAYTYVTGSSYRTVFRSINDVWTYPQSFRFSLQTVYQFGKYIMPSVLKICSDFISRVLHSSHWLKTVGECVCVCVCVTHSVGSKPVVLSVAGDSCWLHPLQSSAGCHWWLTACPRQQAKTQAGNLRTGPSDCFVDHPEYHPARSTANTQGNSFNLVFSLV